jgi:preprotein translocase subunit SecE
MNAKVESTTPGRLMAPVDYAILLAGIALIASGIFTFYYFNPAWAAWVRVLTFVAGLLAGGAVMTRSGPGIAFLKFLAAAMIELRKVVWPTKQETTQTTMVVVVGVLIVGVLMFVIDFILALLVRKTMGG